MSAAVCAVTRLAKSSATATTALSTTSTATPTARRRQSPRAACERADISRSYVANLGCIGEYTKKFAA